MDFRGRNYRYGPFHFHERDLIRSLIVFGEPGDLNQGVDYGQIGKNHMVATTFHFSKKFPNYNTALTYFFKEFVDKKKLLSTDIDQEAKKAIIYHYAHCARNPFLFLSFFQMITAESDNNPDGLYYILRAPHQLDASASAYQLISYFEKTRYWRTWWRKQQVISSRRRSSLLQLDPMTYFGVSFAFSTVLWT